MPPFKTQQLLTINARTVTTDIDLRKTSERKPDHTTVKYKSFA